MCRGGETRGKALHRFEAPNALRPHLGQACRVCFNSCKCGSINFNFCKYGSVNFKSRNCEECLSCVSARVVCFKGVSASVIFRFSF
jgi:hypothetical protein